MSVIIIHVGLRQQKGENSVSGFSVVENVKKINGQRRAEDDDQREIRLSRRRERDRARREQ